MGRKEEDQKTERLILEVERNLFIYDKSSSFYKDSNKKEDICKTIAGHVDMTVTDAKLRWKSVRDNMRKYQNSLKCKSGQSAKTIRPFKYAGIIDFLCTYLEDRESMSNLQKDETQIEEREDQEQNPTINLPSEADNENVDDTDEDNTATPICTKSMPITSASTSAISEKRKRPEKTNDGVDKAMAEFLNEKRNYIIKKGSSQEIQKEDDIDYFMKSMSTTIRKLPARVQADVKYKIHGIVHAAEMAFLYPNNANTYQPGDIQAPAHSSSLLQVQIKVYLHVQWVHKIGILFIILFDMTAVCTCITRFVSKFIQ